MRLTSLDAVLAIQFHGYADAHDLDAMRRIWDYIERETTTPDEQRAALDHMAVNAMGEDPLTEQEFSAMMGEMGL